MLDKGLWTGFFRRTACGEATVIQSVDRAIRVLTALQGSRRMALSELFERLDDDENGDDSPQVVSESDGA